MNRPVILIASLVVILASMTSFPLPYDLIVPIVWVIAVCGFIYVRRPSSSSSGDRSTVTKVVVVCGILVAVVVIGGIVFVAYLFTP